MERQAGNQDVDYCLAKLLGNIIIQRMNLKNFLFIIILMPWRLLADDDPCVALAKALKIESTFQDTSRIRRALESLATRDAEQLRSMDKEDYAELGLGYGGFKLDFGSESKRKYYTKLRESRRNKFGYWVDDQMAIFIAKSALDPQAYPLIEQCLKLSSKQTFNLSDGVTATLIGGEIANGGSKPRIEIAYQAPLSNAKTGIGRFFDSAFSPNSVDLRSVLVDSNAVTVLPPFDLGPYSIKSGSSVVIALDRTFTTNGFLGFPSATVTLDFKNGKSKSVPLPAIEFVPPNPMQELFATRFEVSVGTSMKGRGGTDGYVYLVLQDDKDHLHVAYCGDNKGDDNKRGDTEVYRSVSFLDPIDLHRIKRVGLRLKKKHKTEDEWTVSSFEVRAINVIAVRGKILVARENTSFTLNPYQKEPPTRFVKRIPELRSDISSP